LKVVKVGVESWGTVLTLTKLGGDAVPSSLSDSGAIQQNESVSKGPLWDWVFVVLGFFESRADTNVGERLGFSKNLYCKVD
jgi:hypothetical protein